MFYLNLDIILGVIVQEKIEIITRLNLKQTGKRFLYKR